MSLRGRPHLVAHGHLTAAAHHKGLAPTHNDRRRTKTRYLMAWVASAHVSYVEARVRNAVPREVSALAPTVIPDNFGED